ncbi:MAG: Anti-sigma-28 factor, FlgM [Pseudomonadota bacterium]|jgi:flagellar biosynthesis anti-sigma factor FlgM
MGISKISNLFAANVDAVPAVTPSKGVTPQSAPVQSTTPTSTDAVVLSKNLQSMNRAPLQDAESARAARVDQLKQQVKNGTYKVSKEQVAVAVLRDLA